MPKNWKTDHNPTTRPLGCNNKPGTSGSKAHRYRGETPCTTCKNAEAHYNRELRRGQNLPRPKHGCGTWQAAAQHYVRHEKPCFPCRIALSEYKAKRKAEKATIG